MKKFGIKNDICYLIKKRNDELKRFNVVVKDGETEDIINKCFDSLLRKHKQVKLMEDALVIYNNVKSPRHGFYLN